MLTGDNDLLYKSVQNKMAPDARNIWEIWLFRCQLQLFQNFSAIVKQTYLADFKVGMPVSETFEKHITAWHQVRDLLFNYESGNLF